MTIPVLGSEWPNGTFRLRHGHPAPKSRIMREPPILEREPDSIPKKLESLPNVMGRDVQVEWGGSASAKTSMMGILAGSDS